MAKLISPETRPKLQPSLHARPTWPIGLRSHTSQVALSSCAAPVQSGPMRPCRPQYRWRFSNIISFVHTKEMSLQATERLLLSCMTTSYRVFKLQNVSFFLLHECMSAGLCLKKSRSSLAQGLRTAATLHTVSYTSPSSSWFRSSHLQISTSLPPGSLAVMSFPASL